MEQWILDLVSRQGLLLASFLIVSILAWRNRTAILQFLYSQKWRKFVVQTVVSWNDDLLEDKKFRKEISYKINLHNPTMQDTQEFSQDLVKQIQGTQAAYKEANDLLHEFPTVGRVLILRLHNGERTALGRCLFRVSCVAESLARGYTAMYSVLQRINIDWLAYSLESLLETQEPSVLRGVFHMGSPSELTMMVKNHSYLQKRDVYGVDTLYVCLIRGFDGRPIGLIEVHCTTATPDEDFELRLKSAVLAISQRLVDDL